MQYALISKINFTYLAYKVMGSSCKIVGVCQWPLEDGQEADVVGFSNSPIKHQTFQKINTVKIYDH